jgi:hypothetical protein
MTYAEGVRVGVKSAALYAALLTPVSPLTIVTSTENAERPPD